MFVCDSMCVSMCDALCVCVCMCLLPACMAMFTCLHALGTGFHREADQRPGARPWLLQSALLPSFGEKKNGPLSYQALCLHSAALPRSPHCLYPLRLRSFLLLFLPFLPIFFFIDFAIRHLFSLSILILNSLNGPQFSLFLSTFIYFSIPFFLP